MQNSPPRRWRREAGLEGDSWRTGPETPECWSPEAAGLWRTEPDCSWTQEC